MDINGIAHPVFVARHRENTGQMLAAFGNAVGNGCTAANGGFIGDFDVSDRADAAADNALIADGDATGNTGLGRDNGVRTDFAVVADLDLVVDFSTVADGRIAHRATVDVGI